MELLVKHYNSKNVNFCIIFVTVLLEWLQVRGTIRQEEVGWTFHRRPKGEGGEEVEEEEGWEEGAGGGGREGGGGGGEAFVHGGSRGRNAPPK